VPRDAARAPDPPRQQRLRVPERRQQRHGTEQEVGTRGMPVPRAGGDAQRLEAELEARQADRQRHDHR
jgi:hypothetical protein